MVEAANLALRGPWSPGKRPPGTSRSTSSPPRQPLLPLLGRPAATPPKPGTTAVHRHWAISLGELLTSLETDFSEIARAQPARSRRTNFRRVATYYRSTADYVADCDAR